MIAILFWLCVGVIVYAYAGYPIIMTFFARIRPKPRPFSLPAEVPLVTLLIAAYNEETVIAQKLDNSLNLDYLRDRLQILVAADGSDDLTTEIVQRYKKQGIELSYSPPRLGKAAAINHAVQMARGEIIVFSDANNYYAPDVLKKLVAPFSDPTVGATTGAKRIANRDNVLGSSEGLYWRYESFIKEQETRLGCCTSVAGEILAIRREIFEPLPENIINDDFYIAMRLIRRGYRIVYVPEARSLELASTSALDERVRRMRIVAGRYQALGMIRKLLPLKRPGLAWQIISHKYLRPLVPWAMLGAFVTNILAILIPHHGADRSWWTLSAPMNWILLSLQIIFYGLALVGQTVPLPGWMGKFVYLPTFLVNSNRAAADGLLHYLSGRQTNLWRRVPRTKMTEQDSQLVDFREDD